MSDHSPDDELDALLALRAELVIPPGTSHEAPEARELDDLLSLRAALVTPPDVRADAHPERVSSTAQRRRPGLWLALAAGLALMAGGAWWLTRPTPTPGAEHMAKSWWLETPAGQPAQPPFADGQALVAVLPQPSPSARYVYLLHQSRGEGHVLYGGPLPPPEADGRRRLTATPLTFTAEAEPVEEVLAMVTSPSPLAHPLQALVGTRGAKDKPDIEIYTLRFTVRPAP